MSNNYNKINYTCSGEVQYSTCTVFEGNVNTQSSLLESNCLNQELVDQDQYNQLEKLWNQSDLTALGENCLTYVKVDNKILVKNVLLKYEQEICDLKLKLEEVKNKAFCDMSLENCGLDFKCLTTTCDGDIKTVKDLFQALIDKSCA